MIPAYRPGLDPAKAMKEFRRATRKALGSPQPSPEHEQTKAKRRRRRAAKAARAARRRNRR